MAKILILGSGGREHAMAWSLAGENRHELYCAPGNPGTATLGNNVDLDIGNHAQVIEYAKKEAIDLIVVGAEAPLAAGIVDDCQKAGLKIFGPDRLCAMLEASKLYAREFMHDNHIPHPGFVACDSADEVRAAVEQLGVPIVLKADGLAAGKGVVVCQTQDDVDEAIDVFFTRNEFGAAGEMLSVEECLIGTEMSVFAICDGANFNIIGTAQDYKRAHDDDQGPNTGGMGSIAPSQLATRDLMEEVSATIIQPTLDGMKERGHPFIGILYVGLMIVDDEPYVIEYNVRMGDPETQVVLPLLDTSLYDLMVDAIAGQIPIDRRIKDGSAICVVLAADGYPGKYEKGVPIKGMDKLDSDVHLFHAGTKADDGGLVSNGGRVLNVVALGRDMKSASEKVYDNCARINFKGSFYRKDIGK